MQISLRQSLFRTLLGGIVITALLIVAGVWKSANSLVQQNLDSDIVITQRVLQRLIDDRQEIISSVSNVLLRSYDFRRAVGTADQPSIQAAFDSYAERINTDVIGLVDLEHTVVAAYSPLLITGETLTASKALVEQGRENGFFVVSDTLIQFNVFPVEIPTLRYYLLTGIKFNKALLDDLKGLVEAEIVISDRTSGAIIASTLPAEKALSILRNEQTPSWLDVTFGSELTYVSRVVDISSVGSAPMEITVAVDVTNAYNAFTQIQLTILVLTLVAIAVALGIAMVLARNVSQPVSNLVFAANRVAEGEYDANLKKGSRLKEISALANAFSRMQDRIQYREQRIRYQAQHDVLTGLYNRNYVEHFFEDNMAKSKPLQVVAITVIGFRTINDLYGYSNGDNTLKALAERLLRWPGIAARLAGGEIIYISDTPLDDVKLETLRHILEQPVESNLIAIPVKIAMATVSCPEDASNSEELFRKMNIVTDEAIHSGSWLVKYQPELEKRYLRRLTITTELKRSLASQQSELSMVYQPKVDLDTMTVCSMEALIRWNNSKLGFVPPDEFITIAEQAGLIEQVTTWVMNQTIQDLAYFREQGYSFTIAMNLSTQDIQNKPLLRKLEGMLEAANLQPSALELEITESDLVEDAELAVENLNGLTSKGFKFAIDDFGTGYSSLAYLKNLPVDTIKIDKSFILSLSSDENDQQIVHTVLSLAKVFELKVVAEGVEDQESMEILKEWGCDIAQGYHISRPLAKAALEEWLHTSSMGMLPNVSNA
ncbi:bifunctional diguanylate cyclase/phosphodiesterase [Alteromonas sp. KUL49]|uniref:bifunctional diguanylate cyclase/phosphodiesterase n=1 Tax=Alteromonas sp. KUL49 TaxID=2480798 RepID=UPI00102F0AF3|nr:bifunctional diguanylate cyclase/phosphodiesterase [Alteromonas sp. KUL49]TAP33812.1 GGDEF domain-containing protein [Alteromonas sp. KUL49]GEA13675.1 GGDEF domain-containing protein [Alteromonas sp. KUL49]